MSRNGAQSKRSATGHHPLMPASQPGITLEHVPRIPTYTLIAWTFGRASVIWKIWPAVLLHTIFAAAVVTASMTGYARLEIPTVMLTVLGVVIGFVISYRAMSGYDRYWMGRTCWSDVIKNSRTMGRLIWFHVPPRLTPKTPEETAKGEINRSRQELYKVMNEKRLALDLVEAFSVALKHHIRGELGIYYEDLYHLVRPLHDHEHKSDHHPASSAATPKRSQRISAQPPIPEPKSSTSTSQQPSASTSTLSPSPLIDFKDPVIPPINGYGTFDGSTTTVDPSSMLPRHLRRVPSHSSDMSTASEQSQHRPLLPSAQPNPRTILDKVSGELIPFAGLAGLIKRSMSPSAKTHLEVLPPTIDDDASQQFSNRERKWRGPVHSFKHLRHRPQGFNDGENLPLEILRCLSEWFSVLEDRGTVPGTSLGGMVGLISAFEDNLSTLERILTTPLPYVYSVHIRHTVWLYLFFLPFQLVNQFGYYTIPGVAIAAFIYLGFFAAGEEIEQPFGYDENDLDLDLFCNDIIRVELEHLRSAPCLNAYLGPQRPRPEHRKSMTLVQMSTLEGELSADEGDNAGPVS
ncbi:UPF0187-domain-containing protein [Pluteus cervinus]|uniref:UPF0187-domain-containing protein n=1 Tax=Pluteus cervinus TaxID=181527 RepID=A0ACD3AHX3_9AGAR|nr:UPF0187-domain-containing protein [Pluteus cervinus]